MSDTSGLTNENSGPQTDTVAGAYFGRITELLKESQDSESLSNAFIQDLGSKRFLITLETMAEITRLNMEMQSALDEFTGRQLGFSIISTIEHLSVAMKIYIISLLTIMDLLARLVNLALDLGFADRDVRPHLIFRNEHVKATRIPALIAEYEHEIGLSELRKWRNNVVHRGKAPDPDVGKALKDRNALDSRRYSLLNTNRISDDEYDKCRSELQSQLNDLAKRKQESWQAIHTKTIAMTSDVANELATVVVHRYRGKIIEEHPRADSK